MLNGLQLLAQPDLHGVSIVLDKIQLVDHLGNHFNFTSFKAGFEQLIEFSDGFFGLGGRIDTTFEIGHEIGTHLGGEFHLTAKHAAGNILGTIGNLVLLGQQLQQVGTRDRQKQAARQFKANFAFENIRFFFQLGYLLPDFFGIFPTVFGNGIKEGNQLLGALVNLDDMLLQRLDGGLGKKTQNSIYWHGQTCVGEKTLDTIL